MADRLSLDSTAALAAGMSYGQYKVLHPHTEYETTTPRRRGGKQIPCAFCGQPFSSIHNRRYCSRECAEEKNVIAVRERYQAKRGGGTT